MKGRMKGTTKGTIRDEQEACGLEAPDRSRTDMWIGAITLPEKRPSTSYTQPIMTNDYFDSRSNLMKRRMTTSIPGLVLLSLMAWYPARAGADDGWVSLFDGKTLDGWVQKNGTATYRVEDHAIVGRTTEGSPNSFLCTKQEYGDFELEFDVKVDNRLNSGVQIRSKTKPKTGRVYGPQVEIEASGPHGAESGYVYGEATGRGWLTPKERLKPHKHFKDGRWNHYRIVAKGARIRTWINGHPIEDLTDEAIYRTHPRGFIGLQVHAVPKGAGPYEVRWRNIRIKVLD